MALFFFRFESSPMNHSPAVGVSEICARMLEHQVVERRAVTVVHASKGLRRTVLRKLLFLPHAQ